MITVDVIKDPNGDGKFDFVLKGLSTDNKPIEKFGGNAIADNSIFEELDTGDKYFYSEGAWNKMSSGGGGGTLTPKLGFMQINGVNVSEVVEVYDETSMDLMMENGETWSVNLITDVETGDEIMRYYIDYDTSVEHLITSYIVGAPNVGIDYPNALDVGVNLGRLYGDAQSEG